MKVFISWSGAHSKRVANALREWLPLVVPSAEPFMSEEDVAKGTRWASEIASVLAQCSYGVICITPDNGTAPWLTFEAGALSKSLEDKVSPLLVGVKKTDITGPLTMFQATSPDEDDMFRLIQSMNEASGDAAAPADRVRKLFDVLWPTLKGDLDAIEQEMAVTKVAAPKAGRPQRSETELLEEILERVRVQHRILTSPQDLLPPEYLTNAIGRIRPDQRAILDELTVQVERLILLVDESDARSDRPTDKELVVQARRIREALQFLRHRDLSTRVGRELDDPRSATRAQHEAVTRAEAVLTSLGVEGLVRARRGELWIDTVSELSADLRADVEHAVGMLGFPVVWRPRALDLK